MGWELLEWQNLIFILPFGFALFYVLLLASGTFSMEHDGELDSDIDHDVDLDHDLDHGLEHATHEHILETNQDLGALAKVLSILGVGRVPLSIIFTSFCFLWGTWGFICNRILGAHISLPEIYIWPSLLTSFAGSFVGTRYLAMGLSKIMPATETYSLSNRQLVGRIAEARYPITETSGSALLRDEFGNLHEFSCRLVSGEREIEAGYKVIIMDYDEEEKVFAVRRDPLAERGLFNSSPTLINKNRGEY